MKKAYDTPKIIYLVVDTCDIIATSGELPSGILNDDIGVDIF